MGPQIQLMKATIIYLLLVVSLSSSFNSPQQVQIYLLTDSNRIKQLTVAVLIIQSTLTETSTTSS